MFRYRRTSPLTSTLTPVDQTLGDLDRTLRMRCLRFLCKVCSRHAILPKSLAIPVSYDQTKVPFCHGGFADVWKGTYYNLEVAVKVAKLYECDDHEEIRRVSG